MNRIKHLLWPDSKVHLNVRITNRTYQPMSDWSQPFILADDVATCGMARPRPPESAMLSGPTTGVLQVPYAFSAVVSPMTATQPITYGWRATGKVPVTHTGGLSDTVTYAWSEPGTKLITVTAMNFGGTATDAHSITIYAPVHASFTAWPTSGIWPLEVDFTNESTGDYDECEWRFGDGDTSSECDETLHTFNATGSFSPSLTIRGPGGTDVLTRPNYITVYEPVEAGFSAWPTVGVVPLEVSFTNLSGGDYTESLWDFGDLTMSTLESPTHTYTLIGVYTVSLEVSGPGGSATEVKTAYISVREPHNVYLPLCLRNHQSLSTITAYGLWATGLQPAKHR